MIHEAAAAGADVVKIQALRSREVTFRRRFEKGEKDPDGTVQAIQRPYAPEVERLQGLDLSLDDEAWFVDECRRAGVVSMTTLFTRTAAREVRDLGYEAAKIASYDCASYPLLRDARRWWSTLVVSTGATHDAEIERAAEVLSGADYTFLHCVTLYPTPKTELHLRRMAWLRRFTPRVGFSDHSGAADGLRASKLALAVGADCIERHFTVLPADATKDGPVSITPEQLAELRAFADRPRRERMEIVRREEPDWESALGLAQRPLSPAELLNRDYYRGRVASKVGGRDVFNWEEVELDALLSAS
jgi:sialic acid synthase SpsE